MKKFLLATLLAGFLSGAVHADELALRVEHETTALGADGVALSAWRQERSRYWYAR